MGIVMRARVAMLLVLTTIAATGCAADLAEDVGEGASLAEDTERLQEEADESEDSLSKFYVRFNLILSGDNKVKRDGDGYRITWRGLYDFNRSLWYLANKRFVIKYDTETDVAAQLIVISDCFGKRALTRNITFEAGKSTLQLTSPPCVSSIQIRYSDNSLRVRTLTIYER